jgi:hypothetical protein
MVECYDDVLKWVRDHGVASTGKGYVVQSQKQVVFIQIFAENLLSTKAEKYQKIDF